MKKLAPGVKPPRELISTNCGWCDGKIGQACINDTEDIRLENHISLHLTIVTESATSIGNYKI